MLPGVMPASIAKMNEAKDDPGWRAAARLVGCARMTNTPDMASATGLGIHNHHAALDVRLPQRIGLRRMGFSVGAFWLLDLLDHERSRLAHAHDAGGRATRRATDVWLVGQSGSRPGHLGERHRAGPVVRAGPRMKLHRLPLRPWRTTASCQAGGPKQRPPLNRGSAELLLPLIHSRRCGRRHRASHAFAIISNEAPAQRGICHRLQPGRPDRRAIVPDGQAALVQPASSSPYAARD